MPEITQIFNIVIFIALNTIVALSAGYLLRLFNLDADIDRAITYFLLFFAQIIASELILGSLNKLFLGYLFALNFVILVCAYFLFRSKEDLPISVVLKGLPTDWCAKFLLAFILGFGIVKISINLINPPFGWDCLNYHFTFPVEWLKYGNLDIPITINDDPSPSYYPLNGSLLYLWLMLPFKNVMLADLGQIPFFILAFLAVFSIAKKLNLDDLYAFFAASLFTLVPNYFKQIEIAYVDVMVVALFMVALNYLFLLKDVFSFKNVILFSMAFGLLLGIKTVALVYSILLLLPFLFFVIRNFEFKKFTLSILIFVILTLIFGGFSYIRNFLETGNPLYPLDFKLFGLNIFKGVMSKSVYSAHFTLKDYSLSKLLFHEGAGIQTLIFLLPSIFLVLPVTFIRRKKELSLFLAYFLILPFPLFLAWRYVIPLANLRYLYPLFAVGFLITFYLINMLRIPRKIINILIFICVIVSSSEFCGHQELALSIILSLAVFLLFLSLSRFIKMIYFRPRFAIVIVILLIIILSVLEKNYLENEYSRYINNSPFWKDATLAWAWLNENTDKNNIAYVGRPVPFPLYGTNFKNNVYYISVNKVEPAKLHYFSNSKYSWGYDFEGLHKNLEEPNNYRGNADFGDWLKNLRAKNIDYLFIYSLHQTKDIIFPLEEEWAKNNPDRFEAVFKNETIHIYRLLRS
ncbi:MAG: hypothetical protein NC936_00365 [Candidatus Omnitrophica bacterium]|nr:hypothetical protein [Candidatus Omnitrophota bacterium]MCM8770309.1 hypothetical protein [Candidatus Omnitrophota bacterium]